MVATADDVGDVGEGDKEADVRAREPCVEPIVEPWSSLTDGVCLEGVAIGSEPRMLPALPTLRCVRLCEACWECGSALASAVLSLALPGLCSFWTLSLVGSWV